LTGLLALTLAGQVRVGTREKEKELALGAALASEFRKHVTPAANPDCNSYAEALAKRLARDGRTDVWHIEVVNEDLGGSTHEPTVFPAGYVFVPAVLFVTAHDEAEFAGMLAHAMAHILERHGFRQTAGTPAYFVMGPTMPLGQVREQRKFEIEADRRAVGMLAAAGYDPEALLQYIRREQVEEDGGLLSRFPVRELRVLAIGEEIRKTPGVRGPPPADAEFERLRAQLAGPRR